MSIQPKLSLCMIVRDSSRTLEPCLASIAPWVDELVVVDTGSTDDTPDIARRFGAKLFHFPWIDDFSAARNVSLENATGEWLFWMDSDDTIDERNARKLRSLVDGPHDPAVLGYVIQVHCPGPEDELADELTVVDHVKLIRNHPQSPCKIRFEGRIHEQVLPAIRRLGGVTAWTDIFVVHSGADYSPAGKRQKCLRDLRILDKDLRERPDHPFVLFNLGMTYADMGDHRQAVIWLERCIANSTSMESHLRKAYALLVNSLAQIQRLDDSLALCRRGRELFPKDSELQFREGLLFHQAGQFDQAVSAYRVALAIGDERHFTSIDPGITGYKARHNLALVYRDLGRHDLAELQWRTILEEKRNYKTAWKMLGQTLLSQRKLLTAEIHIDQLLAMENPALRCAGLALKAELLLTRGDMSGAAGVFDSATHDFPNDVELLQLYGKFLFEHGGLADAEASLRKLAERCPTDGAVHHNLGLVLMQKGELGNSAESFRRSLDVRPDCSRTKAFLSDVLERLANDKEGILPSKPLLDRQRENTRHKREVLPRATKGSSARELVAHDIGDTKTRSASPSDRTEG